MKKLGIIVAVIAILGLVAGCASSGGSKGSGAAVEPYTIDLSQMKVTDLQGNTIGASGATVRNPSPFTKNYDDLMLLFPAFPAGMNWADYQRITVTINCYDADSAEITPADGNAMVSLIYDINGDIRGPDMGPGKNTPLKEFNIGGYSGTIQKERGSRSRLTQAPQAILFQNSNTGVKFIEVTEITFHNRD